VVYKQPRLVVKTENEQGRRLHIDKTILRAWREDFARPMREEGIAANAAARVVRGRNKGQIRDAIYRAQQRGASTVVHKRVTDVVRDLTISGSFREPARGQLVETHKAIVTGWLEIAETPDRQGETILAGDLRHFADHLPKVLTDKERQALEFSQGSKFRLVEQSWFADFNAIRVFPAADYVAPFTIFDIGGNKIGLITVIHHNTGWVDVRHVLTHIEYDRRPDANRRRKRPKRGK
jgi:mRNA interferase HigB